MQANRSLLIGLLLLSLPLLAKLVPAPIFVDNMVLQREMSVPVWGTADVGELVEVAFAGQTVKAVADNSGKWMARLSPLTANAEGAELVIKGSAETITVKNVLLAKCGCAWTVQYGNADVDRQCALEKYRRQQVRGGRRQPPDPFHEDGPLRMVQIPQDGFPDEVGSARHGKRTLAFGLRFLLRAGVAAGTEDSDRLGYVALGRNAHRTLDASVWL